jgi:hypothetical protein
MARPVTLPFDVSQAVGSQASPYPLANFQQNYVALLNGLNDPASGFVNLLYDTGTANAYAGSLNPAPSALISGLTVVLKIANANTGASTFNLNNLGAKSIVNRLGQALNGGDLPAGSYATLVYDSGAGVWVLVNVINLPSLPNVSTSPSPNTIAQRDSNSKLFAADPASTDTQGLVTVNYANNTYVALSNVSVSQSANTIPQRDGSGKLFAADPASTDTQGVATVHYINGLTSTGPNANTVALRDSNGKLFCADPASTDTQGALTVHYLNSLLSSGNVANTIVQRDSSGNTAFTNAIPTWAIASLNTNVGSSGTYTILPASSITASAGNWTINGSGQLVTPIGGLHIVGAASWNAANTTAWATFANGGQIVAQAASGTGLGNAMCVGLANVASGSTFDFRMQGVGGTVGGSAILWVVHIPFTS